MLQAPYIFIWPTSSSNINCPLLQHDLQSLHNALNCSYQCQLSNSRRRLTYTSKKIIMRRNPICGKERFVSMVVFLFTLPLHYMLPHTQTLWRESNLCHSPSSNSHWLSSRLTLERLCRSLSILNWAGYLDPVNSLCYTHYTCVVGVFDQQSSNVLAKQPSMRLAKKSLPKKIFFRLICMQLLILGSTPPTRLLMPYEHYTSWVLVVLQG